MTVWRNASYLMAWDSRETSHQNLKDNTRQIYDALLDAVGDWQIMRVWNWIPGINVRPDGGEENYRSFCSGRSGAFASRWGPAFKKRLSAASALGVDDKRLGALLFATRHPVTHAENPLQVPAYEYPPEYGQNAPCFSRGTAVPCAEGPLYFISGTASVRNSNTLYPHDLIRQIPVTMENLNIIADQLGLLRAMGEKSYEVFARVYLRKPDFLNEVRSSLVQYLPWAAHSMVFFHADICRGDLDLEVEVSARPFGFTFLP